MHALHQRGETLAKFLQVPPETHHPGGEPLAKFLADRLDLASSHPGHQPGQPHPPLDFFQFEAIVEATLSLLASSRSIMHFGKGRNIAPKSKQMDINAWPLSSERATRQRCQTVPPDNFPGLLDSDSDLFHPKMPPTLSFSGMYRNSLIYRRNRNNQV